MLDFEPSGQYEPYTRYKCRMKQYILFPRDGSEIASFSFKYHNYNELILQAEIS